MGKLQRKYLHGYSKNEQKRLYSQAKFLQPWIYKNVRLEKSKNLLEVGCGVGAQTEIILKKFPKLRVTGVDASHLQLEEAKKHLSKSIQEKRVSLELSDASSMRFESATFDSAFLCWFLEHVSDPLQVLKEVYRVLKPGAQVFCIEVQNSTLFLNPNCPATLQYWNEYNEQQLAWRGNPFIGAQLGNLFSKAGFRNIKTELIPFHFDSRAPKNRTEFARYWTDLLLSSAPSLIESKRVTEKLVKTMTKELQALARSREGVFFYGAFQASGER